MKGCEECFGQNVGPSPCVERFCVWPTKNSPFPGRLGPLHEYLGEEFKDHSIERHQVASNGRVAGISCHKDIPVLYVLSELFQAIRHAICKALVVRGSLQRSAPADQALEA